MNAPKTSSNEKVPKTQENVQYFGLYANDEFFNDGNLTKKTQKAYQ